MDIADVLFKLVSLLSPFNHVRFPKSHIPSSLATPFYENIFVSNILRILHGSFFLIITLRSYYCCIYSFIILCLILPSVSVAVILLMRHSFPSDDTNPKLYAPIPGCQMTV